MPRVLWSFRSHPLPECRSPPCRLNLVGAMLLSSFAFSAMGVAVAARFTSTTVFPVISNALLLPMFFLSGALYSLRNAPHWMKVATHFDPVAYGVEPMRGAVLAATFSSRDIR